MAVQTKKKKKGSTDRRNIWLLVVTTLLVVGSIFLFTPPAEKINQGLDIQGGLSVVLTAKSTDGGEITTEDMEASRAIIESRVNALGASEATVQAQGTDQILVQIPGLSDTESALNTIGKTGKLEFARLDSFTDETVKTKIDNGQYITQETYTDEAGNSLPSGKTSYLEVEPGTYTPLVSGTNITNVSIGQGKTTSTDYVVNVQLDSEGAAAFAEATKELVSTNGKIVIILDGEVQSAPTVDSEIPDGNVSISGNYSLDDAKALRELRVRAEPGRRPDARPGSAVLGRTRRSDRPSGRHALPFVLLPRSRAHHGRGHGHLRDHLPRHTRCAVGIRAVQPFPCGHRGHRAHHRHGGGLVDPYARAIP